MSIRDNVLHAAYSMQKRNAKQRGIEWKLEYWEWLQIWQDSGHLHERGKLDHQWCMSRHGDIGPYSSDNVKIVLVNTNNYQAAMKRHVKQ